MAIAEAVKSGQIKALVILKENAMHLGISVEQLAQLPAFIVMNILPNEATEKATVVLPACGFAEKRGSMINGKGRLQRLNRAVRPPGKARDDWEILRDLLQAVGGGDSLLSIEDVFRQISETVPQFAGLTSEQNRRSRRAHSANGRTAADAIPATNENNRASGRDAGKTSRRPAANRSSRIDCTHGSFFIITSLLKIVGILFVVILPMVSYAVYAERRVSAFIQDRLGPNRVGPAGLFQPIADMFKLLLKEDFTPRAVNTFYYWLAPCLAVMPAIITIAVVPFGSTLFGVPMVIADINVGILFVFAIASLGVYGIVIGGWASNSKYPFLGGVRSSCANDFLRAFARSRCHSGFSARRQFASDRAWCDTRSSMAGSSRRSSATGRIHGNGCSPFR